MDINHTHLPDGVYTVMTDVVNPEGDKRVKREFNRLPVWKAGTKVVVRTNRYVDPNEPPDTFDVWELGDYHHNGITSIPIDQAHFTKLWQSQVERGFGGNCAKWAALRDVLVRDVPTVREALTLAGWENFYSPILQELVTSGKVTLQDVETAMQAYLSRDD